MLGLEMIDIYVGKIGEKQMQNNKKVTKYLVDISDPKSKDYIASLLQATVDKNQFYKSPLKKVN